MIHDSVFKIRTFHTDAFGHVNNSRHLELLEEARWQFAERIGLVELLAARNYGFIIVDARIRFRTPVFEGDNLVIQTSLVTLGTASGEVRQIARKQNQTKKALQSLFHFILIARQTGESVPIDGEIRECLLKIIESSKPQR